MVDHHHPHQATSTGWTTTTKAAITGLVMLVSTAWWLRSRRQRRRLAASQAKGKPSSRPFPVILSNASCCEGGVEFSSVQFLPPRMAAVSVRCPLFTSVSGANGFPIESCCLVLDSLPTKDEGEEEVDTTALLHEYIATQCTYLAGVNDKHEIRQREVQVDAAVAAPTSDSATSQQADKVVASVSTIFHNFIEVDADSVVFFHLLPEQHAVLGMIVTLSEGHHTHSDMFGVASKDAVSLWVKSFLAGIAVDALSLEGQPLNEGTVAEADGGGARVYNNPALGVRFSLPTAQCQVEAIRFNPSDTLISGLDRGVVLRFGDASSSSVQVSKWQGLPPSWIKTSSLEEAILASEEVLKATGSHDSTFSWREQLFRLNIALHLLSPNLPPSKSERLFALADTMVGQPSAAHGILDAIASGSVLRDVPAIRHVDVNGYTGYAFTETIVGSTCDTVVVLPPSKQHGKKWSATSLVVIRHQRPSESDATPLFSRFWDSLQLF